MVDRPIVYAGSIPLDTDILSTNRSAMVGLGYALQAVLGTATLAHGLACGATSPASLAVAVGPGAIYALQNVDGTAYGALAADTAHQTVKQGIRADAANLATPAPGTAGQSVVYLIQAAYADQDANPVVLPYYNAADPTQAYSGPNNSGTAQNTARKGVCLVSAKAGVAAATGTQTAPAPDAGYVGLYTVTVANGQSAVTAGNIAFAAAAPFLAEKLPDKLSVATADARYGVPHGQCRLVKVGGDLVLVPQDGNRLTVGGVSRQIPGAGVGLPPTGLTVGSVPYVYAYVSGGALALEPSATPPATDPTTGVRVKTGDGSRTLVGMARVNTGTVWTDSGEQRFVLSHFNRRSLAAKKTLAANTTTASTTYVEIAPALRAEFLCWPDEAVTASVTDAMNNTSLNAVVSALSLDGATPEDGFSYGGLGSNFTAPIGITLTASPAGGYHYATLFGKVSAGTGTWLGNAAGTTDTTAVCVLTRG